MVARIAVALLVGTLTAVVYLRTDMVTVDFERGFEGAFVDGFHPRERAEGKYFRWTDGASFVVLQNLAAGGDLSIEVRVKTIRPGGTPLPDLAFTANGVTVHRARALPGAVSYRFDFPSTGSTLRLGIESDTFEAGGGRTLGVQVLGVKVTPGADARASWLLPALAVSLATFLWTVALGSSLIALALSGAFVYLLAQGAVPFSPFPLHVLILAAAGVVLSAALRAVFARLGWLHERHRTRVAALAVLLLALEITVVSYPLTLSSDAEFQANRMSELLQGNWHPTSVTQHHPPFRIPYPVSLYVVAAPLAKLGLDRVPALELVTAVFDVGISMLLLLLAVRGFDDLRAGVLAAALYQLVPMNASSFSAGNFTNLFAVSMLTLGFTFLVVANTGGDKRAVAGAALATLLAVTAHFGMLIESLMLWPVWLGGLFLVPKPARDIRKLTALAIAGSFVAAGIYYLGYWDVMTSQLGRAVSDEASSLTYHPAFIEEQLGWVFCLTALVGSLAMLRRPLEDPFSASASGWLVVTGVFLVVELTTAVEVRYWLQALPLLALASGLYLSRAFERGSLGKIAALAALAYMSVVGLENLRDVMLWRYH